MAIEIKQDTTQVTGSLDLVDDKSGANVMHFAANARSMTTLIGKITQTSPGVITGMGGDTALSLPGGSIPVSIQVYSAVPASTGATITVGIDTTTTYFLNALSVATLALNGQQVPAATASNLFTQLATLPIGQSHSVNGFYAQTATAPGGGPWYVMIDYYLPIPA